MKLKYFLITLPCLFILSERPQMRDCRSDSDWKMPSDTVRLAVIGDVMMHAPQLKYDYREFLKHIAPSLQAADIAVANMEFSLAGEPFSGYPVFSAPDGYAAYVRDCGVDVFLTANNHILDKGRAGAIRTMAVYDTTANVLWTGSYRSVQEKEKRNPLIVRAKGITFALLNFSYGSNRKPTGDVSVLLMDKQEIHEAIERARQQNADFIIAFPHWGTEYQITHDGTQEEWARWLIGEGVDAIVGSHPHVVQDTAHINGVPVIYSVGNAISNMSATNTQLEYYATLRFTNNWQNGEKRLLEPELKYMWCSLPGYFSDNYSTFFIEDWLPKRESWLNPSDYEKMKKTLSERTSLCR